MGARSFLCKRAGDSHRLTKAAMSGSVHSLDTDSLSDSSLDSDEDALLAQQEWEESVEQLQKLFSLVLLPMAGKYFGRSFSYWSESRSTYGTGRGLLIILSTLIVYARYLRLGLGKAFALGNGRI